jgi:hypothetical protein
MWSYYDFSSDAWWAKQCAYRYLSYTFVWIENNIMLDIEWSYTTGKNSYTPS